MKQYVVDAFADRLFGGNPAAVCVLDQPISDDLRDTSLYGLDGSN